ncbi:MAG: DNA translocase FtsK 4TM domain-containing protein [Alphaproteobacteria bacterium]|nr:DNA translocase FtsK 4TM domain-containing protein [Alphaproteobacteria bacterium]
MPRSLIRSSSPRSARSKWLPETVREAASRILAQFRGGLIILVAAAFAMALLSHNTQDPSWNTGVRTNAPVHNWLGDFGSYVSDFSWQFFGFSSFLFAVILTAWGWRVASGRKLDMLFWRSIVGLISVITLSTALSALYPETKGDLHHAITWLSGGVFGKLLSAPALALLPESFGSYALAVVMIALTMGTMYMASALTLSEWHNLLQLAHVVMRWLARKMHSWMMSAWQFIHSERSDVIDMLDDTEDEEEEDYEPKAPKPVEKPVIKKAVEKPKRSKQNIVQRPAISTKQPRLALHSDHDFPLPSLELLQWPDVSKRPSTEISEEALEKNAKLLESVLGDFGVHGQITKVSPGPVVTLYELEPSPGTRAARVISLADDIARNMSATSVRVAVVPGRNAIGIELPNRRREMVFLRELLSNEVFTDNKGTLPLVLGKDIAGNSIIADLARMPHLLIAGTTGSGKSVAINTMILSLIYRLPPQKCRFIMIDPKMLELSVYEGIPHLLAPVVTEPKKAIMALKWTVREMEERYRAMSKLGVRNIEGYNMRLRAASKNGEKLMRTVQTGFDRETGKPTYEEQPLDLTELPFIVVIVDEMADLMIVAGKEIESAVQRLAQMARAAGIHIMMATQRPSVDVITGTIKANFPTRISFQVTSKIDSRTILGEQGAEQLLGQGDMLYMAGGGRITRVHGPFVHDGEVEAIVKYLKAQGEPEYLDEVTEDDGTDSFGGSGDTGGSMGGGSGNELYDKAVDIVLRERKASVSFVQRHLQIGYNRAATLVERMESDGIISSANHVGKREIYGRKPDED